MTEGVYIEAMLFTRDDRRKRLVVTATDLTTLTDVLAFQEQQIHDGTWSYAVLYDASARTDAFQAPEVRQLQEQAERLSKAYGRPGPLALLAGSDLTFGVGRMFEILSERERLVAVFRDREQATHWLDMQQAMDSPGET